MTEHKIETLYSKLYDLIISENDKKVREQLVRYMHAMEDANVSRLLKMRYTTNKEGLLIRKRTYLIPGIGTLKKCQAILDDNDYMRAKVYLKQFVITDYVDPDSETFHDFATVGGMTLGSIMRVKATGKTGIMIGEKKGVPFKLLMENELGNIFISASDLELIAPDSPEMDLGIVQEEKRMETRNMRQNAEIAGAGINHRTPLGTSSVGFRRGLRTPRKNKEWKSIRGGMEKDAAARAEEALFSGGGPTIVQMYRQNYGLNYHPSLLNDYIGFIASQNKRKLYALTSAYNKSPRVFASSLFGNLSGIMNVASPEDIAGFRSSRYFLNRNPGLTRGNIDAVKTIIKNITSRLDGNNKTKDELTELAGQFALIYEMKDQWDEEKRSEKLNNLIENYNKVYEKIGAVEGRDALQNLFNRIVAGNIIDIAFSTFNDEESAAKVMNSKTYRNARDFIQDAMGVGNDKSSILRKINILPLFVKHKVFDPYTAFKWRTDM